MKKVWNIYFNGHLMGVAQNKHLAILRCEFESGRKMKTTDGTNNDHVYDEHIKCGQVEAKYENPRI